MIDLFPSRLHWIKDDGRDCPADLCAHSPIRFEIDGQVLVSAEDGDFTVSAASIYLLRSLTSNHRIDVNVHENLFPCCGHSIIDTGDSDVQIIGCPNGVNFDVVHVTEELQIHSKQFGVCSMPEEKWRSAVLLFVDAVRDFYNASLPKQLSDEHDRFGFDKMFAEWDRRRALAQ